VKREQQEKDQRWRFEFADVGLFPATFPLEKAQKEKP